MRSWFNHGQTSARAGRLNLYKRFLDMVEKSIRYVINLLFIT
jgi:hypothetical protein